MSRNTKENSYTARVYDFLSKSGEKTCSQIVTDLPDSKAVSVQFAVYKLWATGIIARSNGSNELFSTRETHKYEVVNPYNHEKVTEFARKASQDSRERRLKNAPTDAAPVEKAVAAAPNPSPAVQNLLEMYVPEHEDAEALAERILNEYSTRDAQLIFKRLQAFFG